jgi:hypothetical protein
VNDFNVRYKPCNNNNNNNNNNNTLAVDSNGPKSPVTKYGVLAE